ncbi:tetratricopeptide repeat-containing sulfotransferase family protein [Asticcacaulis sp.]|uniref:tetratricopeptide repeat-containing sulfotransferase family protein n=1 Tax=Asticcacaulis sp. TaxID=1872648 RepID=UPI003F7BB37B
MTAPPHLLVLKGRQAFQAGDFSGALSLCGMRLNEAPDDGDALELKAVIQSARKDFRAAETTMRQAIAYNPSSDWALNDLTQLLHSQGHKAAAEAAARAALIARPEDPQAHLQLAVILGEKDDLPAAEFHNRRALELAGPHPQILVNLGLTLYNQGRVDDALPALMEAHRMQPDSAQIMAHISRAYEAKRDMADAYIWLERAEALGKRTGEDFTLLRALYLRHAGQPKQALELIDQSKDAPGAPALLERAVLLDKLGRHDEAMQSFVTAKARLASDMGVRYDAAKVTAEFAALKAVFTVQNLAHLPKAGIRRDTPQPIFILGFPRSGTTLIEQMLSSHPDVSAGGELPFVHEWQKLIDDLLPGDQPFPQRLAQSQAADYRHIPGLLRDYYLGRAETYGLLGENKRFFTDKMPLNDVHLPLIRLAFPEAAVIRMIRHPLDVAISMLSHNLTHGYNSGYRLETIIAHMVAMHDLNSHYDAALGHPALDLKYEQFVAEQKGHTMRVLGHIGLGFHEACLRFHTNPRHAPTPSYAQVSKPINDRSIGRWKPYARFFAPYMDRIGPVIETLGYEAPISD